MRKQTSMRWKQWFSFPDLKRCKACKDKTGTIYPIEEAVFPNKLHLHCRCYIKLLDSIKVGTCTYEGINGADYTLIHDGILPSYYISKKEAINMGWKPGESLSNYCPGKMIAGGVYNNRNRHLPEATGRVWFEADINYYIGKRNSSRILYSNDGLGFVTFDHYSTFSEIIQ